MGAASRGPNRQYTSSCKLPAPWRAVPCLQQPTAAWQAGPPVARSSAYTSASMRAGPAGWHDVGRGRPATAASQISIRGVAAVNEHSPILHDSLAGACPCKGTRA